ncbi:MAG: PAS domain-containing protein [Moorea sp. SIO2B7]|nr:PAS domain-containing protein [Moorena sp. SIO2B7]
MDEVFKPYTWSRPPHIWTAQQLELIFAHLPQRTFWKNKNLEYIGCNQKFAQNVELKSPDEIIGKVDEELKLQELVFLEESEDQEILDSGLPHIDEEKSQITADGTIQWVNISKIPLRDRENKVIGLFCSYEDITERKQSEFALQEANRRLETQTADLIIALEQLKQYQLQMVQQEKMSPLGNLVAGIAHDINNPVGWLFKR